MTLTTYTRKPATLWDNFFNDFYTEENHDLSPRAKVTDNEKSISVNLELPGVKKEDIKVEVHDGVLTISAEKHSEKKEDSKNVYFNEISYGAYKRSFRLSNDVLTAKVNAVYEDGILKLELEKKEKALPKQIEIK